MLVVGKMFVLMAVVNFSDGFNARGWMVRSRSFLGAMMIVVVGMFVVVVVVYFCDGCNVRGWRIGSPAAIVARTPRPHPAHE